ncbi:MAG: type II toxin-antitoxin system RelE/ParE family toxin [Segetibacter sp.]
MRIVYSKKFVKQLARQPEKIDLALKLRLELFGDDINNPLLNNHALKGKLKGFYSINVNGDVRAIYEIINGDVYLYQMIGTHSQLYG